MEYGTWEEGTKKGRKKGKNEHGKKEHGRKEYGTWMDGVRKEEVCTDGVWNMGGRSKKREEERKE